MKRRDFIQKTAASSALLGLTGISLSSFSTPDTKKITILHTNDVHSHIEPFPIDHPKNPNMGGAARRAAIIENIRKEEKNVLLLDAGDIFQGTPYFNYYGGELEFKLMSMMQYDLATMGNHDFDNGIDGFYAQLPHAKFDFVSANYDFKNTVLNEIVKPLSSPCQILSTPFLNVHDFLTFSKSTLPSSSNKSGSLCLAPNSSAKCKYCIPFRF